MGPDRNSTGAVRCVVQIHSATSALRPHIEWALAGVLGVPANLDWTPQPAAPSMWRAEHSWTGRPGQAAEIVSALARWGLLRFEVTELPTGEGEGLRWSFTPTLGMFAASTNAVGDIMVHEQRLKAAVIKQTLARRDLGEAIDQLLGMPWDVELEVFRLGGEDDSVRWLHRVG